jgi:hypothetical protein
MQSDYFVIERAGPSSYPLLQWDQSPSAFRKGTAVDVTEPIQLRLSKPVPRNPVMVDHHCLPEPVFSPRIRDVLEPLNLYGVQLVPADVKVKDGDVRRYWMLHVYNEIPCVDRENSVFKLSPSGLLMLSIDKLALDERVLGEIPPEQRRVFVLAESTSTYFCHKSVADLVLALQPEGLRFIPADRWNDSAGFKP